MTWPVMLALVLIATANVIEFDSLWNYDDPKGTEARFRDVRPKVEAAGDHGRLLELDTQIARAQGLQGHFSAALHTLDTVRAALRPGETRAQIRLELEWGRALRSSGHPGEARPHFESAARLAQSAGEDALEVDARHMVALVEPDPARSLALNLEALRRAESSRDQKARRWQASLWNNIGMTYHDQGRLPDALAAFQSALALRERQGGVEQILEARFMVAWTERLLGRLGKALAAQTALEREHERIGAPDGFVLEELAEIHLALAPADRSGEHARLARTYFGRAWAALKDDPELAGDPARLARMKRLAETGGK